MTLNWLKDKRISSIPSGILKYLSLEFHLWITWNNCKLWITFSLSTAVETFSRASLASDAPCARAWKFRKYTRNAEWILFDWKNSVTDIRIPSQRIVHSCNHASAQWMLPLPSECPPGAVPVEFCRKSWLFKAHSWLRFESSGSQETMIFGLCDVAK